MSGDVRKFKRKLFGGFDRRDVTDYIVEISKERNALAAERDTLEGDKALLECEITRLANEKDTYAAELENAKYELESALNKCEEAVKILDELRNDAFVEADESLKKLDEKYLEAHAEADAVIGRMRQDMEQLNVALNAISKIVNDGENSFAQLIASVDNGRTRLYKSILTSELLDRGETEE